MKAAVTGWAWRTPLGDSVEEGVRRLFAGERAARPPARPELSAYACQLTAPIPGEPRPSRHRRFLRRMGLFALEAAQHAARAAGVGGGERVGLFAGVGGLRAHWNDMMPALEHQRPDGRDSWARGLKELHPFWMLHHLSNNAHALLSVELAAQGEGMTFGGANAGAQALASAQWALAADAVDVAVVLAADSLLEPEVLVELGASGAASRAMPGALEAPYSVQAAGFVPGEAAAALVLEPPARAAERALAYVEAVELADGSRGRPREESLAQAAARLATPRTRVLDGVGWADPSFDAKERELLAARVGDDAWLTASSSAMGQLGAATAVVQTIVWATCLRLKALPPIAGLRTPARGPLRLVSSPMDTLEREVLALSAGAPGLVGAVRVEMP